MSSREELSDFSKRVFKEVMSHARDVHYTFDTSDITVAKVITFGIAQYPIDEYRRLVREKRSLLESVKEEIEANKQHLSSEQCKELYAELDRGWEKYRDMREMVWGTAEEEAKRLYNETHLLFDRVDVTDSKALRQASRVFKNNHRSTLNLYMHPDTKNRYADLFDKLWQRLQFMYKALDTHRKDNLREARRLYDEAQNAIDSIGDGRKPREAREMFSDCQRRALRLSLHPDDWEGIKKEFENLWAEFQRRSQEVRREAEERHRSWRHRQKEGLERLVAAREKVSTNLGSNYERLAGAKTPEFAETVREWIQEGEQSLAELDAKIQDAQERLQNDTWT